MMAINGKLFYECLCLVDATFWCYEEKSAVFNPYPFSFITR